MFEYVIIGGGIAGLYAYDKLLEQGYRNIILLEANNYVGGRMGIDVWYGARLAIGAGIGRKNKDILLQQLCKKYDIELKEFEVNKDVSKGMMTETELRNTVAILKREYNERRHKELTFRQYGMEVLGAAQYQKFIKTYEYTDMEKADTYETLNHYGFDDGYSGWTGLSVPWDELLDKMVQGKRIKLNEHVNKVYDVDNILEVETEQRIFKTAKVVIATTVDVVRSLLGRRQLYRQVEGQPFMRIYGKFGHESAEIMHSLVPQSKIVGNQIKRIIPMSEDVYMIVYCDNASARYMENHVAGNDKESREFLSDKLRQGLLTQEPLQLTAIKKYYWHIGTHYMRPFMEGETYTTWIKDAQRPTCNIYVVGEAFSRNQGWVEGALESVEAVFE